MINRLEKTFFTDLMLSRFSFLLLEKEKVMILCRNCHDKEAMDFHKQRRRSAEKMQVAFEKGDETCIDCHKGIAHKLPEGYEDDDD